MNDFAVIGDTHIVLRSVEKALQLFEIVEALGLNAIWLGDLLDTKAIIRGECLNLFFEYFKRSKLQHIVLVGNHDWFNLECKDHSLRTLSALANVKIVDKLAKHPTLPFVFVPYIHDKAEVKRQLAEIQHPGELILFGHFELSGFDYGNGHICENGLAVQDFKQFKMVISGHFHKYQTTDNFTYLGTPFSHSFGESDQQKYLGVLHLRENQLELMKTPFERHVTLKLDLSKKTYQKKLDDFLKENEKNVVRVQLTGSPENISKIDKSKYQNMKIKWEDKSESESLQNKDIDESLDNKTQFMSWATEIRNLDPETAKLGLQILEGVNAK